MRRLVALCLGFFALGGAAIAADAPVPKGQLPTGVAPTHYAVELTILPDQPGFSGHTVIDLKLDQPASTIWLHGRELVVSEAKVIDAKGAAQTATWTEIPDSDGVVKLTVPKPVAGPTAQVSVTYTAKFNRSLEGLYRSDEDGQSYVYSQMEPIDARRAFPSFDEPRFKTPYDVTLTVRAAHAAISNTPVIKEEPLAGGLKRLRFATTQPLPTYLIAFAVGPFDVVEWAPVPKTAIRDHVVPLRGVTVKGKGEQIKYALSHTAGLLTTLEQYFGTPYPFEKLDIIAALDFSAGAMENAGAIVYRESLMLMDDTSPLSVKRRYALVHAHEMSHQWFGDLVTPAWWNDIWLNEAFASWMEYKTTTAWDAKGEFGRLGLSNSLGAMNTDANKNARQITQPIASNDDIQNAFDGITYEKGNGVLAMFEHYYGTENFRKGVQLHLSRHAHGTATAADFLKSIADANNDTKGVAAFSSFLDQPGVPLVDAALDCTGAPQVTVTQSRYVQGGAADDNTRKQLWKIPLCIASGDKAGRTETCTLLETRTAKIPLKAAACPAWIMPNSDGAGYLRFAMAKKDWDGLTKSASQLTEKEVLSAIDSLGAAFNGGTLDIDAYLDRMKALLGSRPVTWDMAGAAQGTLSWVNDTLIPNEARAGLQKYILDLYGPLYAKVGLTATSALDKENPTEAGLLRGPVVSMVAQYGKLPAARTALAKSGAAYLGIGSDGKLHPEAVDVNVTDQAVSTAVEELGMPAVDAIVAHLKTERNAVVRGRLLGALTRSTDAKVAARVRDLALTLDLRVNEVPILINSATRHKENAAAGWAWFKANFEAIKAKTPVGGRGNLVGIGGSFCSAAEREDYRAFFVPRVGDLEGGPREFAATLDNISTCAALVGQQRDKAKAYFAHIN
ncbi:MAG: M1 family metallopeptidase [Rhodospirillaceae bacterium]